MLPSNQVEELVCWIASLERADLTRQLTQADAPFPVDFSAEYLERQSVERLRHLLFAVCVQSKRPSRLSA